MPVYGLTPTGHYRREHTDLQSFVTPAAAALWNMRWQVRGYMLEREDPTERELSDRFTAGSGLRAGGLGKLFARTSWEDQLARFGEMLLLASFSVYEGWASDFVAALGGSSVDSEALLRTLTSATVRPATEARALRALSLNPSSLATTQIQPGLRLAKNVLPIGSIPSLLNAMRAYKSARNALAHRSGHLTTVDQTQIASAAGIAASTLRLRSSPDWPTRTASGRVRVSWRTAVGATAVLLRLVVSVDAEASGSVACENDALSRVRSLPEGPSGRFLPASITSRNIRVQSWLADSSLPVAQDPEVVYQWLRLHGVVAV